MHPEAWGIPWWARSEWCQQLEESIKAVECNEDEDPPVWFLFSGGPLAQLCESWDGCMEFGDRRCWRMILLWSSMEVMNYWCWVSLVQFWFKVSLWLVHEVFLYLIMNTEFMIWESIFCKIQFSFQLIECYAFLFLIYFSIYSYMMKVIWLVRSKCLWVNYWFWNTEH